MIRVVTLVICVLLLTGVANARVITVRDVVDYTDNNDVNVIHVNKWGDYEGYFFWPPGITLDHSPYFRLSTEDWGWKHDMNDVIPADVNGIVDATLSIRAWDVDSAGGGDDIIYANGVWLGMLEGEAHVWTTTTFTIPPQVLTELLEHNEVEIFINIDKVPTGNRVLLGNSVLEVTYTGSGEAVEPNATVYRFWSPVLSSHFYTINETEKDSLLADPGVWTYEGVVYHTFGDALDGDLMPVYRFWSDLTGGHFYTVSIEERDKLLNEYQGVWIPEGPMFYAYPEGKQPAGTKPVYRYWSPITSKHFYTISETERQYVNDNYAGVWIEEGIAWYAFE